MDEDKLHRDYVLVLQNDSVWYHRVRKYVADNDYDTFRRKTVSHMWELNKDEVRNMGSSAQLFIMLTLWEQYESQLRPLEILGDNSVYAADKERFNELIRRSKPKPQEEPWTEQDKRNLQRLVKGRCSMPYMMTCLGRLEDAIQFQIDKGDFDTKSLKEQKQEIESNMNNAAEHFAKVEATLIETFIQNLKENIAMSKPIFENKSFVNGLDVNEMSEAQLIAAIKTVEGEIAELKTVKSKSTKIAAKIAEMQGALANIVAVLDAK